MKLLSVLSLALVSTAAHAASEVSYSPIRSPEGPAHEIVLTGDVAEDLYLSLEAKVVTVRNAGSVWENKSANGIVCGKLQHRDTFACSMVVDPSGVAK